MVDHGLVFLETPKAASTAIRRMLEPQIPVPWARQAPRQRHIGVRQYDRLWAGHLARDIGRRAETFCVVRDPLERAESWYRYRQRPQVAHKPTSSRGLSFADFLTDVLSDDPPPHARIGDQARFTGFDGIRAGVDHIFDYQRLDLLVDFLSDRLGRPLTLEAHNVTPETARPPEPLPPAVLTAFRATRALEYALYDRVAAAGALHHP
jgi:hypothetical protein